MHRSRRLLAWLTGIIALVVLTLASVAVWSVRRSFPEVDGRLTLDVLDGPVDVYRDGWGIPHLYADSVADLARAQGFTHAQDRFWEMDVRRHITAGRLSELFGASQVETDTFVRTLGWRRVAEEELSLLSDDTRRWLEAYAEGVNAYLARHADTSDLSLEYAVLGLQNSGYEPEPWGPVDSLAWLKAMAWDLRSNMGSEIDRALLTAAIDDEQIADLYPPYPYGRHGTIVDGGSVTDGRWLPAFGRTDPSAAAASARTASTPARRDAAAPKPDVASARTLTVRRTAATPTRASGPSPAEMEAATAAADALGDLSVALDRLPVLVGEAGPGIGSNAWVVSGEHTATGMPLLANDPHLGPALPSIWYQNGLHCRERSRVCPLDVVGFSFSGLPGVIIGHNDRVAWGFTNLGPDVTDLYVEHLDGDRYEVDGSFRPLDTITDTIRVAGGDDVEITIRSTRHGPLLSDASDQLRDIVAESDLPAVERPLDTSAYGIALRWTALEPRPTADGILALNTAQTFEQFRAAAALFEVPAQNLMYADVDGHIGYQAPGRIPIRAPGHSGRYPVPGWTTATDWQGFIPFDELPWEFDPDDGIIASANEAVTTPDYVHDLSFDWAYGYRGTRIRALLEDLGGNATLDDLLTIQLDTRNLNADALVPHLLSLPTDDDAVRTAQDVLAAWDHRQAADSAGGALFQATWRHLLRLTFHDELPESTRPGGDSRWFEVVRRLTRQPNSVWWEDQSTAAMETRDDVLAGALRAAVDELSSDFGDEPEDWRWGELHTLTLTHQTLGDSGIGFIERLFNRGPYETAGGKSIVNATGWTAPDGYDVDWVPSMRMLVNLADLDSSRWVNLTGQSGHAYHPHYTDMTPLWRDGETTPMRMRQATILDEAQAHLRLEPAS